MASKKAWAVSVKSLGTKTNKGAEICKLVDDNADDLDVKKWRLCASVVYQLFFTKPEKLYYPKDISGNTGDADIANALATYFNRVFSGVTATFNLTFSGISAAEVMTCGTAGAMIEMLEGKLTPSMALGNDEVALRALMAAKAGATA